jgi:hypothetical protein
MTTLKYERLAIVALDALLAGGLEIVQHYDNPDPNEWYFRGPMGTVGPFESPEVAIKAAIQTLYRELAEQMAAATTLGEELAALKTTLDQAEQGDGLGPWRRALDNDPAKSEDGTV